MNEQEIIALFRKYEVATFTESEAQAWKEWCEKASLEQFHALMVQAFPERDFRRDELSAHRKIAIEAALDAVTAKDATKVATLPVRWMAAAGVAMLITAGILWFKRQPTGPVPANLVQQTIIQPGKQGAVLTLADGTQVSLDSLPDGTITTQQGTQVSLRGGQVFYDVKQNGNTGIAYNVVSTPRGRQFRIALPDGSIVWLNASSSVSFPVSFTESTRRIKLTGEAYLEVMRDDKQPFVIELAKQTSVEVLGTSFNINAYDDESTIRTTLVNGAVSVNSAGQKRILQPGQQAEILSSGNMEVHQQVDLSKVIAWKDGMFNFEDADIREVMRQLSRWYNIDVIYQGKIPDIHFGGKLSRDMTLNGILETLQDEEVHYKLEGRQLTILP